MGARKLLVELVGDASSLRRAYGQAGDSGDQLSRRHLGLKTAAVAAGGALVGLGFAAKVGFEEFNQAQQVTAQTEQVIKSTGGAAGVTTKQVQDLSGSIMEYSGIDDEAVQSGANLLLGFTNIRNGVGATNQIFDRATKVTADLSTRMGTDMTSAAKKVGKALNDPAKGMQALSRYGVTFTEAQKKQVEAMVAAGDTMGAQNIILTQLEARYGGAAKAAGDTMSGKINIARESLNNFAGSVVASAMPALMGFAGVLGSVASWMSRHETLAKVLVGAIGALAAITLTVAAATKVWAAISAVQNALMLIFIQRAPVVTGATVAQTAAQQGLNTAMRANPIGIVITALAALAIGLAVAWNRSETFRNIVTGAFNAVKAAAQAVSNFITQTIPAAFQAVLGWVRGNWPVIATLISGPFAPVVALATNAFGVRSALQGAISGLISWVASAAQSLGSALANGIVNGIAGLASALGSKLKSEIGSAIDSVKSAFDIFSPSRKTARDIGKPLAEGVIVGLLEGSGPLPEKFKGVVARTIEAGRRALANAKSKFQREFGELSSLGGSLLQAKQRGTMTPAEQALADLQSGHDAAEMAAAKAQAQADIDKAETPEEKAAAQKRLNDLLYQEQVAALTKTAEAERVQQDERDRQQQDSFNRALTALQTHLQNSGATSEQAMEQMKALFASYGLDMDSIGGTLGDAFVDGLAASLGRASGAAGGIGDVVRRVIGQIGPRRRSGGGGGGGGGGNKKSNEAGPVGGGGGVKIEVNIHDRTVAGMSREQARRLADDLAPEIRRLVTVGI